MRKITLGIVMGFLIAGCAGLSYRYYGLDIPDGCYQQGKLLAHDPKDDLPLTVCQPDAQVKGKCLVMKSDEYARMKADLVDCQERLKECQN